MVAAPSVPDEAVLRCLADFQPTSATGSRYAPSAVGERCLMDGNVATAVQGLRSWF